MQRDKDTGKQRQRYRNAERDKDTGRQIDKDTGRKRIAGQQKWPTWKCWLATDHQNIVQVKDTVDGGLEIFQTNVAEDHTSVTLSVSVTNKKKH